MEIPIRPKLYSFHEAFNAVGRKLFCDWTDEGIEEINAQKCHPPEDVGKKDTLPDRLLRVIDGMGNPSDLNAEGLQDLQNHIDGANAALLVRQSDTVARAIKALKEDPKAYQKKYDLWFRHDKAYKRLIDILHDGHAASWIVTPEGDTHEIPRTRWGAAGDTFTPNLPGNCGEYKGVWGEILIDRKSLDHSLKTAHPTPAAGLSRRDERKKETLLKYKGWSEAAAAFNKENRGLSKHQVMIKVAPTVGADKETFRKMVAKHYPDWAE